MDWSFFVALGIGVGVVVFASLLAVGLDWLDSQRRPRK